MSIKIRYGLIGLILLAFSLRLQNFFLDSLQADEALFATWGRVIAVFRDPLLQNQLVDKPPLMFYLQALFYPLLGPVAQAARLPNLIASIFLIPLSFLLVLRLYRQEFTAFMVALLVSLSPLVIRYSATVYLDPLLLTLLTIVLVVIAGYWPEDALGNYEIPGQHHSKVPHQISLSSRRHLSPWIAGLIFGFALAAKYQAMLYLPLIVGLALINRWRQRQWLQGFLSLAAVLVVLFLWDLAQDGRLNLIGNQWRSLGGLRLIWSQEIAGRLDQLIRDWNTIFPNPAFLITFFFGTPILVYEFFRTRKRSTAIDMLFLLFSAGYLLLHWLTAIPVWSRYVLLVSPIVTILFVRVVVKLGQYSSRLIQRSRLRGLTKVNLSWLWLIILLLSGLTPAWNARNGEVLLSDLEQLDGSAEEIANYLADSPSGTVLYDHWYSWRWRYFLFDSEIFISWFPDARGLMRDLSVFGRDGTQRFIALPNNETAQPIIRAVNEAGFLVERVSGQGLRENADISLFQIVVWTDN